MLLLLLLLPFLLLLLPGPQAVQDLSAGQAGGGLPDEEREELARLVRDRVITSDQLMMVRQDRGARGEGGGGAGEGGQGGRGRLGGGRAGERWGQTLGEGVGLQRGRREGS